MNSVSLDYCIETERLTLRRSEAEEVDFVWDATRYPGFNDGMLWDKPDSREELLGFHGKIEDRWQRGEGYVFTYHDNATGHPIGRISVDQRCGGWNIGFWTHPRYQGAGYASEALSALVGFCFETLGIKQVEACHAEWNLASRRVLENAGFRFKRHLEEGFEKNGEWIPQDTLSLSLKHWEGQRAKGRAPAR